MHPQSCTHASYCPTLHLFAWFSSPFPKIRVPGYFSHPLPFFPPPWFLQFLHLLLGLQSSLTACARPLVLYLTFLPSEPWGKVQVPELGVSGVLVAVECKETGWKLGQSNSRVSKVSLAALQGQYGSASFIDHIGVSVVRWKLLSLSSMGILLPKGMQIAPWELSLHYADRCRKFPPVLDVSSLFEELLVEVNGYQALGNHIPGELSNLE